MDFLNKILTKTEEKIISINEYTSPLHENIDSLDHIELEFKSFDSKIRKRKCLSVPKLEY